MLKLIIEILMIALICSIDSFVVGIAYGSNKIKILFFGSIIISFFGSFTLGFSLFFGNFIAKYIKSKLTHIIGCVLLFAIGIIKFFSSIKIIKKNKKTCTKTIDTLLIDNIKKEKNTHTTILSSKEAIIVAIALSIDGLAVGFGAGLTNKSLSAVILMIVFSYFSNMLSIFLGEKIGQLITRKIDLDLSYISGITLIILAILKLPLQ